MTQYLIILFVMLICLSSFTWGSILNETLQLNLIPVFFTALGFLAMLGFSNLISYPIVYFRLPSNTLYYLYIFLFIIPLVIYYFKHTPLTLRFSWKFWSGLMVYLVLMILIATKRGLAEQSFDTVTYLSTILENAYSSTFGQFKPNTGLIANNLDPSNSYQSYYYFSAFLVKLSDRFLIQSNQPFITITSHVYMWVMSILYFILNYTLTVGYIKELNIKKRPQRVFLIVLVLGFMANFYYNNTFTFYGNTYRLLITGFLTYLIAHTVTQNILDIRYSLVIALVGSALISTSSSAYFIVFILYYVYVMYLFIENGDEQKVIDNSAILIVPIVVFVSFFLVTQSPERYLLVLILNIAGYGVLIAFRFLRPSYQRILFWILKSICLIGIPSMILIVSFMNAFFVEQWFFAYFTSYSFKDMVWDYFRFDDFKHTFINLLLLGSLMWYLLKGKSGYRKLLIFALLIFINPLSFVFLSQYLTGNVFYRVFDVIFNTFTIILILGFLFESIQWDKVRDGSVLMALAILVFLTHIQINSVYHFYFNPSDDFDPLYRISAQQADVMSFLKTTIITEGYPRAKVISQIHGIKGFVPKIETPLDYHTYRKLDLYSTDTKEISPLWNIFIFREYSEMSVFDTPPDYENTCNYLYDARIDFILVDKNQFYIKDEQYYLLHHRVRDCSSLIYENDVYLLYQFDY